MTPIQTTPATQAVLFDLDGTLLDTAPSFYAIISNMLKAHNVPPPDYTTFRPQASNGSRAMLSLAFGLSQNHPDLEHLTTQMLHIYQQAPATHTHFFSGMPAVLAQLESNGIPWGVVTNKPERFTLPLMEALALKSRSRVTICPEQVKHTKPNPEPLLLACKQLDILPETTVYVGDHQRDIVAGQQAGMQTIGALYGYIAPDEDTQSWQADHYVNHASELSGLLARQPKA